MYMYIYIYIYINIHPATSLRGASPAFSLSLPRGGALEYTPYTLKARIPLPSILEVLIH